MKPHLLKLLTTCWLVSRLSRKPPFSPLPPADCSVRRFIHCVTASVLFTLAGALTAFAAPPGITTPVQIGAWPGFSRGGAQAVAVSGRFAYVAIAAGGLAIFGISNPASPVLLSRFDTSGNAKGVQVVGNLAYVADGSGGLKILNLSGASAVPPVLTFRSAANGILNLQLNGLDGKTYRLETTTNLIQWSAFTNVAGPAATIAIHESQRTTARVLFYRASEGITP